MRATFFEHGLPFIQDYSTSGGIIKQYEADDTRALRQQHYYVYVIAAYLLHERKETALAVLEERFSKRGIRRKFASLWRNLNAEPGAEGKPPCAQHPT